MMDDECSRRDFLRKFAYLSTGALTLSVTTLACYGPMPGGRIQYPMVSGFYFLNANNLNSVLQGCQEVPLRTAFTIEFTDDMNTAVPAAVSLTDAGGYPAAFANAWSSARLLVLTPAADLAPDMEYTLSVEDAEDARGYNLMLSASSTAQFKTVVV